MKVRFLRQYSIDHFVLDFYAPEIKLAIELDGNIHELEEHKDYDKKRQSYIETFGIKFIRISNEELMENPDKAFEKIEEKIKNIMCENPKPTDEKIGFVHL